jgi:hypothetical protein
MGDLTSALNQMYPYWQYIKTPEQLGMGTNANDITKNVQGMEAYVDVILYGHNSLAKNVSASTTGKPLGNRFFLSTGSTCCASGQTGSCTKQDRYIYIDNIPTGAVPLLGQVSTTDPTKGLLVGMIEDISDLNPSGLYYAFMDGGNPVCSQVTLQTVDLSNNYSQETHYVVDNELSSVNPCVFPNNQNPWNPSATCVEGFSNINYNENIINMTIPKNMMVQLYILLVSILAIYIFYKIVYHKK